MFRRAAAREAGRRHSDDESNNVASFSPTTIQGLFERWVATDAYISRTGNNVSSVTGSYAGRSLVQATGSQQPDYVSSDSLFGNRESISHVGANSDELNDAGASAYDFVTRTDVGTGFTFTGCVYLTAETVSSKQWFSLEQNTSKSRMRGSCMTTGLNHLIEFVANAATITASLGMPVGNGTYWFAFTRTQGTGTNLFGGSASGGTTTFNMAAMPASTASNGTGFRLGRIAAAYATAWRWSELSFYTRPLTSAEIAQLKTYYVSTYGASP